MSKEGDKASVFRTTKVRAKLKGDGSWLRRDGDAEAENQEEKPWLAEVRARRLNGAPEETSPASSPVAATPAPTTKPNTERAPTTGYRSRGIYNQPVSPSTTNGFSKTTQFTKKPSDSYKKIAPHTVKPTSENQGSLLSPEEQDKRTEAASNVLKQSSVRQRSYVLSAAKKFEAPPADSTEVINNVSFVAKKVTLADEDESAATVAPASAVQPSPVVPVTSVASAPEPTPPKIVNTSVKTTADVAVNQPVAPNLVTVTPEPVEPGPLPKPISNNLFEDTKPGSTKVATPLSELITECIQAVSTKPEPDISRESETAVFDLSRPSKLPTWPPPKPTPDEDSEVPKLPAPVLLPTASPTRSLPPPPKPTTDKASDVPKLPAPAPLPTVSPTQSLPAPPKPSPFEASDIPELPAPVLLPIVSPTQAFPAPPQPTPYKASDVPEPPAAPPAPLPTVSPTGAFPAPPEPTLFEASDASELPAPVLLPIMSPTRARPAPVMPVPMSPTPVTTTTEITVKTEPAPAPEPEPEPIYKTSPKPSSNVDMLAALSNTLLSFDTTSSSIKADEPALAKEEGGLKDSHTTESSDVEGDDDEDSDDDEELYKYEDEETDSEDEESEHGDCDGVSQDLQEDHLSLDEEEEEEEEEVEVPQPAPTSPGSLSQEVLSELRSEIITEKSSGPPDLLTNDVTIIPRQPRSVSMQREEEKQTDETAKETQSKEDNADVWSSRVTTNVTESSSADPFDPYPIGTTSPNSSSDLLQPLSSISINRKSSTEYLKPAPETRMSGNALESLADDIIPINTGTTRMSSNALESLADDVIPFDTGTTRISSRRSWARTWETDTSADAEPSQEAEGQAENQQTMIKFERKSSENDSPWDRWTSPTVYNITSTTEQEGEKSYGESQSTTTITTTVREIHSQPEPVMNRYESYSRTVAREEPRVPTPEPESKKGFVYLKEYVNSTEMSSLNSGEGLYRDSDYLTSSSINYSYSSPARVPLSSTCTFCGRQVGDDSKITIEHLGINCHPSCFQCGVCSTPMGDLLHSMFIHGGKVHCESCYSKI